MLLTIVNWIIWALAGAMDLFTRMFFSVFDLEPVQYLTYFPILGTAYSVFKGLGYGLVFVLAAFSLIKFFQPGIFGGRESNDTPMGVLFKAVVAVALVYGGNYILQYIMEIATVPYEAFRNLGIAKQAADTGYGNFWSQLAAGFLRDWTMPGVSEGTSLLVLVALILIGFNFFKLVVEIAERYVIVGVLLFTSPPFFALSASADTVQSFKSWIKMFISSCIMMFVSVFSCKLVLSGLSAITGEGNGLVSDTFLRLLLVLAMCKVSQHLDSYLKQIGLGTAETGGALLDDILATGTAVNRYFGSGSSGGKVGSTSGSSVLGSAASAFARYSPVGSFAGGMASEAKRAYTSGESPVWDKIREAGERAVQDRPRPFTAKAVADTAAVVSGEAPADDLPNKLRNDLKESAVDTYGDVVNPRAGTARKESLAQKQSEAEATAEKVRTDNFTAYQQAVKSEARAFGQHINAEQPYTRKETELLQRADEYTPRLNEHETNEFYKNHGIQNGYTLDEAGELTVSPAAAAAGVTYSRQEGTIDSNNDSAKAEFLCETYGAGAADTFDEKSSGYVSYAAQEGVVSALDTRVAELGNASDVGARSIESGRKSVAEKMAFDPKYELSGDDQMGSAMLNKMTGTDIQYSDVNTASMPAFTDVEGREFKGGHIVSAKYTDESGKTCEYSAVNEAGYRQMLAEDPDKAEGYEKVESDTGAQYWERRAKTGDADINADSSTNQNHSEIAAGVPSSADPLAGSTEPAAETPAAGSSVDGGPGVSVPVGLEHTVSASSMSADAEDAESFNSLSDISDLPALEPVNNPVTAGNDPVLGGEEVSDVSAATAVHSTAFGQAEMKPAGSPAPQYESPIDPDTLHPAPALGSSSDIPETSRVQDITSSDSDKADLSIAHESASVPSSVPDTSKRHTYDDISEFLSQSNQIRRESMSDAQRIDNLASVLSHTDIFAGRQLSNVQEFRANGCTGWSVDTVNGEGMKAQYIGIDTAAWQAMSAELRGKFTEIPPLKGRNIEYVTVKGDDGALHAPAVTRQRKEPGLSHFEPPARRSSNRAGLRKGRSDLRRKK